MYVHTLVRLGSFAGKMTPVSQKELICPDKSVDMQCM